MQGFREIAGKRFGSNSDLIVPIEWAADLAHQQGDDS
jgi:hypothetical protein